jgi:NAD-dependent DNA ligase
VCMKIANCKSNRSQNFHVLICPRPRSISEADLKCSFVAASGSQLSGFSDLDAAARAEIEGFIAEGNAAKGSKGKASKGTVGAKRKAKREEDDSDQGSEEHGDDEEAPAPKAKEPAAKRARNAEGAPSPAVKAATASASAGWSGAGKVVLFTGFRDAVLESAAKANGATIAGSFTKAVNLLIVADASVDNAKTNEAASKGVPVMTADDFASALGVERAGKAAKGKPAPAPTKPAPAPKAAPTPKEDDGDEDEDEEDEAPAKRPAAKKPRKEVEVAQAVAAPRAAASTSSAGWSGAGKVVLFTGFRDAVLESAAKANGATIAGSFTKAVNLLIVADASVDNAKTNEAASKGVPVMTADDFASALGVERAGKAAKGKSAPSKAAGGAGNKKSRAAAEDDEDEDGEEEEEEEEEAKPVMKAAAKAAVPKPAASASTSTAASGSGGWSPSGEVVVFSGFRDKAFEAAVISGGGSVASSFTKAVTLVVSNDPSGQTGKVKEARSKGVRVVSGDEFGAMVHAAPVKAIKAPPAPIPGAVGSLPAGWSAAGQVVLFTGFRDDSLEKSIRSAGGDIAKSFTKAVTLVVAKDASINTGKVAEALAKGIPVADATSLAGALGAPVPAKVAAATGSASTSSQSGGLVRRITPLFLITAMMFGGMM